MQPLNTELSYPLQFNPEFGLSPLEMTGIIEAGQGVQASNPS